MQVHKATSWALPAAAMAVLAAGGALIWLGFGPGYLAPSPPTLIGGWLLAMAGVGLMVFAAWDRVRHDTADQKLRRYGCQRCGYEAHLADIEHAESYACPTCGETIYE